ncbi:hypothetical protein TRAPUB_3652 [Trametes pubescens]|uniref:Uncharacterized protein n=1 Tax=Trametes pubescens TaxID=154538 RepID=A0A1M2VD47_TRAPU|nr:hypothetical protein TRAPUB_3652 [Trametes pubescens]
MQFQGGYTGEEGQTHAEQSKRGSMVKADLDELQVPQIGEGAHEELTRRAKIGWCTTGDVA